ncbi:O-acetylhomoserine sulfhydrylase / O-succinylhomoserine sulfhydrylase [Paramagnetospirillum magnetotacticum MS-1]|uniref:O-acetylhomoserine sulfhydrylase / O-succinylhomoserine sulfhydrylase n=2 Tax=Paramagnetospirillum magnetotacticum TaxID=188 RepID=A0A0C2V1N5_PARME|nr:O-acetylhomoserine sulfhydrylase / O-succinylhomoserine sulfhydrylase [Paramagnetospirillum magnetotacticum MS-1]
MREIFSIAMKAFVADPCAAEHHATFRPGGQHRNPTPMTVTSANPETIVLHAGYRADPATGAVAVPIYQTTSYQFRDTEHAANLFALKELGNIYTRLMNPTTDVLEQRLAALEGGVAALAVASGQAASTFAILNLAQAGDNFVTSTDLYGGTWNLFANTFKQLGIEARFVDPADPEAFVRATDDKTRAWYAETLPNPKLQVFPIAEVAKLAEKIGVPLIVDNTASPVIAKPLSLGAHIVVYSTTKYIGGHGTSIGGAIVDGGTFDWEKHAKRFPLLNEPDPSYHGAVWTQAVKPLGPIAYIIRARVTLLRDIGAAISPFNAFQALQGLETLPLRIREHSRNATAVAEFLAGHHKVAHVIHPSLQDGEYRRRADAVLKGGYGGLLGFELKGGADAGRRFIDALKLFYHVANIGDARSLAIHPASTTHSQLSGDDQLASGVTPGYVRLSIGIEHIDDILADLRQALDAA